MTGTGVSLPIPSESRVAADDNDANDDDIDNASDEHDNANNDDDECYLK